MTSATDVVSTLESVRLDTATEDRLQRSVAQALERRGKTAEVA